MAHKVHPIGFRLRHTEDWKSRWIAKKDFPQTLHADLLVRKFLTDTLRDKGLESIEIERFSGKLNIVINSARPGLIIGRGGAGIEELRKAIVALLQKNARGRANDFYELPKEIRLEIREIKNPWESA